MGEIRFVGTGETRGYPYPVCKKCTVIIISFLLDCPQRFQMLEVEQSCAKMLSAKEV